MCLDPLPRNVRNPRPFYLDSIEMYDPSPLTEHIDVHNVAQIESPCRPMTVTRLLSSFHKGEDWTAAPSVLRWWFKLGWRQASNMMDVHHVNSHSHS